MTTNIHENRFIVFKIGKQQYALPLLSIMEVITKPDITPVPNMPNYFEGMINLRGQILGVFNVNKRLGNKTRETQFDTPEVIIVIEHNNVIIGMIVDEVIKVIQPEENCISPAPIKEDSNNGKDFVDSVIQLDNEIVIILNITELLELERYKVYKNIA